MGAFRNEDSFLKEQGRPCVAWRTSDEEWIHRVWFNSSTWGTQQALLVQILPCVFRDKDIPFFWLQRSHLSPKGHMAFFRRRPEHSLMTCFRGEGREKVRETFLLLFSQMPGAEVGSCQLLKAHDSFSGCLGASSIPTGILTSARVGTLTPGNRSRSFLLLGEPLAEPSSIVCPMVLGRLRPGLPSQPSTY
jgi:hypothetical protein